VEGWEFDPAAWQVVNEGGDNILIGQGRLNQPLAILGRESPEWVEQSAADLVISYTFNLDPQSAGARLVFRYTPAGYYALEVFPGLLILRRNNLNSPALATSDPQRGAELILTSVSARIQANTWHEVAVWMQGSRLFVYLIASW
jgi:hypothetical protein